MKRYFKKIPFVIIDLYDRISETGYIFGKREQELTNKFCYQSVKDMALIGAHNPIDYIRILLTSPKK